MRVSLGAALLAAIALVASACGSSHPASSQKTSSGTVSSSGLILGGRVRCTATLTTPVEAGQDLGVSFAFHNVSNRPAEVELAYGGMWVLIKSPGGTTYDTRVPLENERGPITLPTPIAPGATKTVPLLPSLRVRWEGPLRITPGCGLTALRPVRVAVTSPGLPASESTAVNAVVTATGHLLDHCRPRTSGVSLSGRIDPPSGGNWPPLQARCSIRLRREGDFYAAQVLVLTPPDLRGVRVDPTYEAITTANVRNANTQVLAWQFVVTRRGATSVYSAEDETGRSGGGRAPDWMWSSSGPRRSGDSQCGFSGGGFGGLNGPDVYFLSGCGR